MYIFLPQGCVAKPHLHLLTSWVEPQVMGTYLVKPSSGRLIALLLKTKQNKFVFLQPVIKQTLKLLWDSQLLCSVLTFVQQWRPHDLFEYSIKLCPLEKGGPPGI